MCVVWVGGYHVCGGGGGGGGGEGVGRGLIYESYCRGAWLNPRIFESI